MIKRQLSKNCSGYIDKLVKTLKRGAITQLLIQMTFYGPQSKPYR
jgi:hypothetical protein